jgi:multiple sugar transport system substrate-binding protein
LLGLIAVLGAACLSGCGQTAEAPAQTSSSPSVSSAPAKQEPAKPPEPITLSWYVNATIPEATFNTSFKAPIEKKYNFITLQYVSPKKKLVDLVATQEIPDVLYIDNTTLYPDVVDLNLQFDLTATAKKFNFDFTRLEPSLIDAVKQYSTKGELFAMPSIRQPLATIYNKDIFDKFGVAYPKDFMTWDDALELGKKLTRKDGSVDYFGLKTSGQGHMYREMALGFFDASKEKAAVETPAWQAVGKMLTAIGDIAPQGQAAKSFATTGAYLQATDTAMFAGSVGALLRDAEAVGKKLNWDMATYPVFKEAPKTGPRALGLVYVVTGTGKHKDEAFQTIAYMLSDEMQGQMSRSGIDLTPLNKPEILNMFALDNPAVRAKHWQAMVTLTPAKASISRYDSIAAKVMSDKLDKELLSGSGKDVNTLLREATEEIDKKVAEAKQ